MAHIHEKIDFTVAIFVVHDAKVLIIHHRKLDKWLPLGGHIELDEDPEQAALREAREESGLDVELLGERPPTTSPGRNEPSRRIGSASCEMLLRIVSVSRAVFIIRSLWIA